MAQPAPSFLESVSQRIIEGASSIDAHIDADTLVARIAADKTSTSSRSHKALGELKDLARRAPTAVAASQDAVRTLLGVVTRLTTQALREDNEDDSWEEPLQDALNTLGHLIGEAGPPKVDQATASRAETVAELVVRFTENGKVLLRLLGLRDISTQYDALVLLQRVYLWMPNPIENALLAEPLAVGQLMQILQSCQADYLRNECLGFLLLLTASNSEIQMIVTIQGLVETIFAILEDEDLTIGTKVSRDLLHMLVNLVGNSMCQKYIRESDGIALIVAAMSTAISGRRPGQAEQEDDDDHRLSYDHADVPDEVRWACLSLLADAALAIAGKPKPSSGGKGGATGSASGSNSAAQQQSSGPEVKANQDALVRAGAVSLCSHLLDARVATQAKIQLVTLLDALATNSLAAQAMQSDRSGVSPLSAMVASLLDATTPIALRIALGRVVAGILTSHKDVQSNVCSTLSPQLDFSTTGVMPPGRQVVALLEEVERGRAAPVLVWFGLHLVLAMLTGNADVQSVCARLSVSAPRHEGAAMGETFLELLLRAFSATVKAYVADGDDRVVAFKQGDLAQRSSAASGSRLSTSSRTTKAEDVDTPAAAVLAMLKLLSYWLAACPSALIPVATSPVMVPIITDLTSLRSDADGELKETVEGLASLLLGILIQGDDSSVDVGSLMSLLAGRVGIEEFHRKVEELLRSEMMQRRIPKSLQEFVWFDPGFRDFVRDQYRAVQRRMVQLYVTGGVSAGGAGLSEDVADHYKQIIRVQDTDLKEVRRENEQLRREVENFMTKSLQASSFALADKAESLSAENVALHSEVEALTSEVDTLTARCERGTMEMKAAVTDLERQLQSMVVSYEQVDQTAASLRRQNAELQAIVQASNASTAADRQATLEKELASARQRVEELQNERADLLDALGRIVAASPSPAVQAFVAPLGPSAVLRTTEAVASGISSAA